MKQRLEVSVWNWSAFGRRFIQSLMMIGLMYVIYNGVNWDKITYDEHLLIWVCLFLAFGLFCLFAKETTEQINISFNYKITERSAE